MYDKRLYVFKDGKPLPARLRNYGEADFEGLIAIQQASFPPPFPEELWWNEEQLTSHTRHYPEGAVCIEVDGELAGSITSLRVDFDSAHPGHTWEDVTDNGYISNHRPDGNTVYVVDICIKPDFRGMDLGKHLMQALYELVVRSGADRLLGGGRMPGFHRFAAELSPEQYAGRVLSGELRDPVLTFLLKCGRTPVSLVEGYLDDAESMNYAMLMEWRNPFRRVH